MKIKNTYLLLAAISLCFLLTTCKKYPENNLWFKNPKKIPVIKGHIIEYNVNGIDSLDLLNLYYKPVIAGSYYPYNKTTRDVKQEYFQACCPDNGYWQVTCDLYERLDYSMQSDKKTIRIGGGVDTVYYNKQLFLSSKSDIDWQIQYLDKKGKSKIKTTYNGNIYEITFKD